MTDGGGRSRFPRVDALLGAPLNADTAPETFDRFVDENVAEFDQLDFKRDAYPATEDGRAELAKDVCAFANGIGGVLICGIAENQGTASKLMPFQVSDADVRHVNGVIAQRVAPMPAIDVFAVADNGSGFLVISVPASPWIPHAVITPGDIRLSFPVRNGSQTRYLREPELADRYRNRFTTAAEQVGRLDEIRDEGVPELSRLEGPWIYLAVVPNHRTIGTIGVRSTNETTDWLRREVWQSPCGNQWIDDAREVGVRRTISAYRPDAGGPSRHSYAEFHADGSSFAAVQIRQRAKDQLGEEVTEWTVAETLIVDIAVALAGMLARHALRQGAAGEAIAEFGIATSDARGKPTALVHHRQYGLEHPVSERRLTQVPPSRHTIDLGAAAEDATDLLITARMLATDTVQAFGLAEVLQIDEDGRLRFSYFGGSSAAVRQWAERHGAKTSDATSVD